MYIEDKLVGQYFMDIKLDHTILSHETVLGVSQ